MLPPQRESAEIGQVDPRIWRACAGACVQIPAVQSRVYYFPQGHVEHCNSQSLPLSSLACSKPVIPCVVRDVRLLADSITDEVYARVSLQPVHPSQFPSPSLSGGGEAERGGSGDDGDKIVAFAKILTPSDANNGGGFSVPRFCADSIFPPLNFHADPPVQVLSVTDIHGIVWEFRHIYRGTPRRHLLTTGWSRFVNHKKLIAGDSVVFMRNSRGDMFISVRRALRSNNSLRGLGGSDYARWREQFGGGMPEEGNREFKAFCRSASGSLASEVVADAVESAAHGLPLEVVYYPRVGWSDFVVRADLVEASTRVPWGPGMRVKMAMETEDSSRLTWFQGTVSSSMVPETGPWPGSPWRMLQVAWDEPEVLQNVKRVSPWQVELVASPQLHPSYLPTKRLNFPQNLGFMGEGEGEIPTPIKVLCNSTIGNISPSLNYISFPAGMQGARQNFFNAFSFTNLMNENSPPACIDASFGNNIAPGLRGVSTELNIRSALSDELSPDSQGSYPSFGTDAGDKAVKAGRGSFQLFGKIIHFEEPVENDDTGSMEDDCSKGYSENDGANNVLDLSLTYRDTEQIGMVDVQLEQASASARYSL